MRVPLLFFALLLLFIRIPQASATCSSRISGFDLRGLHKTQSRILILWSGLEKGQSASAETLDAARQRLLDTALFQRVSVIAETPCAESTRVIITIKEKHYYLIYPRINRNGDGDLDFGIKYQASNLFGRGQSVALLLSRKNYINGNTAHRFKIDYDLPLYDPPYRIKGRFYRTDTLLSGTSIPTTERLRLLDFSIGRDWHTHLLPNPITVFALASFQRKELDHPSSDVILKPGDFNSLGIRFEYDDLHRTRRRRFGLHYTLSFIQGAAFMGSDFTSSILQLEGRHYWPINDTDNINMRYIIGLASGKAFEQDRFSIGGASTVRGIESNSVGGNGLWLLNLEYLKGFAQWPSLRVVTFTDIANVFEHYNEFQGKPWQLTIGTGIRWKIRSFVKTDLFIEYGYDPTSGYSRFYAGTQLIF